MAHVERINPSGLAPPPGDRFAHVVRSGNHVWVAGQTARTADGVNVGIGDPRVQADQVYANLATAMASVGGTLANIVKVTIFLTPGDDVLAAARAAQNECLNGKPLPAASSMVIVRALVQPDYVIEIEAEAILDD
jgi:enamine deaminase RidA (YjgF/YER057c/UK114 family)